MLTEHWRKDWHLEERAEFLVPSLGRGPKTAEGRPQTYLFFQGLEQNTSLSLTQIDGRIFANG